MNVQASLHILKIGPSASLEEAKRAQRNLALLWHPDRWAHKPYLLRKRAERQMQKINVAYETAAAFLLLQQRRRAQAQAHARASAVADARAREAQAIARASIEARARRRTTVLRNATIAISCVAICSLAVFVYVTRDLTRPTSRHLDHSRLNANNAKAGGNHANAPDETAKEASFDANEAELLRPGKAGDVPKQQRLVETVAVVGERKSSELAKGVSTSKEQPSEQATPVPRHRQLTKRHQTTDTPHKQRGSAAAAPVAHEPDPSKFAEAMNALQQGRYSKAAALFEEIGDPSIVKKVSGLHARALQGQASKLAKTKPYQAKALLLKAVQLNPGNVEAHFQLGLIYTRLRNRPKAIVTFQRAAKLDPQFAETFFNLGYVYTTNKNFARAKEMYSRVVELAPPFIDEALFNLAVINEKLGERDKSIENLEEAIAANPENQSARRYLKRLRKKQGEYQ